MFSPQGANGASGGRGGVTLEEMEQLYDAKLTPAQARQSSSWSDYFQVRSPDGDGYLTLGEAKWQWQNGQGGPVTVGASTLDFSGLHVSNDPGKQGRRSGCSELDRNTRSAMGRPPAVISEDE